jgi:isoaspartyl peptidase/L-asparaginase-like protein (Ntn-hydrolase superfamily)
MKISRRKFIQGSAILSTGAMLGTTHAKTIFGNSEKSITENSRPIVISTWKHGIAANEEAWKILIKGGRALDAVENGVRITEADPDITSVGYGGYPDRDGHVTLDACIMDEEGNAGSVAFLEHIVHHYCPVISQINSIG